MPRTYIAIDLKSYYASCEAADRNLDPLTTHLVVADASRTQKTICLAVSPSLKAYGIPGRARLFQVVQRVKEINAMRLSEAVRQHKAVRGPHGRWEFSGYSSDTAALAKDPSLGLDYITAPPRMARYLSLSADIYAIYLKYIAPEDIHVYSIDEVFMDVTDYLKTYGMTGEQLARRIIRDVFETTRITAAAGVGANLYLAKVAMDIVAKHVPPDKDGVHIASLDEYTYRRLLWDHRPLTDFWRIGPGYARKLCDNGLYTMGDIARCSMGSPSDYYNEDLLYRLFGVNAELLIDHAWGWEPCTIRDIKAYRPSSRSLGSGQVLPRPYTVREARLIVREMTDLLALDLVDKGLVTDQLVLTIGYDSASLSQSTDSIGSTDNSHAPASVPISSDYYGRRVPKHSHGTKCLGHHTNSSQKIIDAISRLYDEIIRPGLLVHRVTITAGHVISEAESVQNESFRQLTLFDSELFSSEQAQAQCQTLQKERRMQQAVLNIRKKFGKNAILKGMNLEEGAMTPTRNNQIGGHKA